MASITKLLRRQPQTSEAELEYVRERTVARLHGLNGEVDASDAPAVAQAIVLDAPAEAIAAPETAIEPEAVVEAVAETEAPTIEPEAVAEPQPAIEPEAVVEAVAELEPEPASVLAPVPEAVIEPEPEPILEAEAVVAESEPAVAETEPVVAEAVIAEPEPEPKTPSFLAEAMAAAAIRAHGKPASQPEPEPVAAEPEPEPVAVVEPEVVSEAQPAPKRSRRWWSSSKPEPEPQAIVEAEPEAVAVEPEPVAVVEAEPVAVVEAEPVAPVVELEPIAEPVAAVAEPEPEPTVVEVAAVAEPIPEPVAAAAPEPDPGPVAIPVAAERTLDIKRESIWEAKVPEAPKPTVKRAKPRPSPSLPGAKPAAVAAAPAPGSAFCPYCALSLVPAPTATRRCPRCRQRIIVKHVQGHVVFLTEAAVAVFDAERQRAVDGVRWARERTSWLKLAAAVGASPDKVARLERARLTEAAVTSSRQLYMSTAERSFRAAKREDRWEIASRIRREQAAAVHKAAGSLIPPPAEALALHREAAAVELRGINKMAKSVQLIGSNCCPTCEADDGRTFRIVTEMRETRLPHADCPKGLCRCRWDLVVRDEAMVRRYLQRKDRGSRGKRAGVDPAVRSEE